MEIKFKIEGIDCANCAAELEEKIQKLDGIKYASLSFIAQKLIIEIENKLQKDEILHNLKKLIKKEEPDVTLEEV